MHRDRKLRRTISLLAAALAYYSLYYRSLFAAYFKNTSPRRPTTIVDSFRMISSIHEVRGYTAVFVPRLAALHRLCREMERRKVPGDVIECGVYNGGSAALMASVCCKDEASDRRIWLFDSFEGLPKPTEQDGEKAKSCGWWCHGDLAKVRSIFHKKGIPESRVRIVKGWFHETFPGLDSPSIALLHIDADWYDSVKLCLEKFYDHVLPGGYIVIDDYGHWEGCRKATDEFLRTRGISVKLTKVDYTGRYFQKPVDAGSGSTGQPD